MPGIRLSIPMQFTDRSRPILRADAILPARGALVLFDASHGAGAWGEGRGTGLAIPNVAASLASTLTGQTLNGQLEISGTDFSVTRTPKQGLHVSPRAGASLPAGSFVRFNTPGLAEYVFRNPDHSYYLSQWTKATRNGEASAFTGTISTAYNSYAVSLYRRETGVLGAYPVPTTDGAYAAGARVGPQPIGQTALSSVATTGWIGAKQASASLINAHPFMLGKTGPAQSAVGHPSLVIYRCYVEDLTISGRSFSEVDALDNEAYTRECLTAGGRYYGDTYTAPTN